jgi:hypothetical protein
VRALAPGRAGDFRKFHVVTDRDGQSSERRVEDAECGSGRDVPLFSFEAGHVELALDSVASRRAEDEAVVVNRIRPVVQDRNRPGHDVDPIRDGQRLHEVEKTRCLPGQIADLFTDRFLDVAERKELNSEIFRKHEQMNFVVRRRFDQRRDLIAELLERLHGANEVLQRGDANALHGVEGAGERA